MAPILDMLNQQSVPGMRGLASFLDLNSDGNVMDDVGQIAGALGKYFRR